MKSWGEEEDHHLSSKFPTTKEVVFYVFVDVALHPVVNQHVPRSVERFEACSIPPILKKELYLCGGFQILWVYLIKNAVSKR